MTKNVVSNLINYMYVLVKLCYKFNAEAHAHTIHVGVRYIYLGYIFMLKKVLIALCGINTYCVDYMHKH